MKIKNCLIIADLHLGITKEIYDSGVVIPKQAEKMAERVNNLKKVTHTKKLIILGDVKHKVPGFSVIEKYELEKFFSALKFGEIIIVKGNHDGNIERMIPAGMKERIKIKKSLAIGNFLLTHGHRRVKTNKKIIVIGHNQPHIKFRDDVGAIYVEPVWVHGRLKDRLRGKRLIIMPAFNELCGATVVNKDKLLGPIAKQLNKRSAHVFLLDGTDLGTLTDLKFDG